MLPIIPGSHKLVICFDFGSLYPSIMITNSICPTTIVNDPCYLNLPGVEYNIINWQKRIYTRTYVGGEQKEEMTFTKFDSALARYCHDDVKMSAIIDKAIQCVRVPQSAPETISLLQNAPIKDVMAILKTPV
ncbi:MAG: hypothetical protein EOP45_10060 [Sphingobacteriaceae bacterium]|nr:MAG: hypothetical protein EOP45_10060 [Sphingobacteriaceae bacterium]